MHPEPTVLRGHGQGGTGRDAAKPGLPAMQVMNAKALTYERKTLG